MAEILKSVRNFSIQAKTNLLYKYYSWRIKIPQEPCNILFRSKPYHVLFVLGHMRAGSSLLTHILNNNPDIIGYGETHLVYAAEEDFKNLIFKVFWHLRDMNMSQKYVMDKLLHNNKLTDNNLLKSNHLRIIFLLREPQDTLSSILKLKPQWGEEKATSHYIGRLAMLEEYAKLLNDKEKSIFFTHEQLINKTEAIFSLLQSFLAVKQPFTEEYELLNSTGKRGVGDSSENIKAGRIIRTHQRSVTSVKPELLEQAQKAFKQCKMILEEYSTTLS